MLLSKPVPGEFYRRFNDRLCQIIALAKDSENLHEVVVYQELYGKFQLYVCPLREFLGEIDMRQHPDAVRRKNFERVVFQDDDDELLRPSRRMADTERRNGDAGRSSDRRENSLPGRREMSDVLEEFLDLQTKSDKILYMEHHKQEMTSSILCSIAHSLDFVEKETDLELRFYDIIRYLRTLQRYESSRLR